MPIYEYRCTNCGFQKEFLQKVSDPPKTACPQCGQETLSKMLTAAGFQLKGSGWYATDFRNKGAPPATGTATGPKGDSKSDSAGESKGESKADSKPAGGESSKPASGGDSPSTPSSPAPSSGSDSKKAGS